jgi:glutamyl/glutaminyl-tRNA synthetase
MSDPNEPDPLDRLSSDPEFIEMSLTGAIEDFEEMSKKLTDTIIAAYQHPDIDSARLRTMIQKHVVSIGVGTFVIIELLSRIPEDE